MAATWATQEERGSPALLAFFTRSALALGRPFARLLLVPISAYFVVAGGAARRASRDYLARALGREPRLVDVFRHVHAFASVTLDRLFLLNDRHDLFAIEVSGADIVQRALFAGLRADGRRAARGAFVIGAHLGSFEAVRASGRGEAALRVSMVMYEDNARALNRTLSAINPGLVDGIIPLGRVDSMLRVKEALDRGGLVGMLADRTLGDDDGAGGVRIATLFGAPVAIPTGPFRMAAMLKRPVVFIVGLYRGGNRYAVHYEELFDFSAGAAAGDASPQRTPADAIDAAIARYVERLEHYCRVAPYNWFNFFDYWGDRTVDGAIRSTASAHARPAADRRDGGGAA